MLHNPVCLQVRNAEQRDLMLGILLPAHASPAAHTLLQAALRAFCRIVPNASQALPPLLAAHAAAVAAVPLRSANSLRSGPDPEGHGRQSGTPQAAQCQAQADGRHSAGSADAAASTSGTGGGEDSASNLCATFSALGLNAATGAGTYAECIESAAGAPDGALGPKPQDGGDSAAMDTDESAGAQQGPARAAPAAADARFATYCTVLGTAAMEQLCALERAVAAERRTAAAQASTGPLPEASERRPGAQQPQPGAADDAGGLAGVTGGGAADADEMQVRFATEIV